MPQHHERACARAQPIPSGNWLCLETRGDSEPRARVSLPGRGSSCRVFSVGSQLNVMLLPVCAIPRVLGNSSASQMNGNCRAGACSCSACPAFHGIVVWRC